MEYVSADLDSPLAMANVDITDLPFDDESFDLILCSHVLEHVHDDRLAMRELRRVLKPDGWALLLVPISADVTFEDPSIVRPSDRLRLFGQADHVRRYGPDYVDRLRHVELEISGANAEAKVPGMCAHLEGCPACAEDHESLRDLIS